MRAAICRTIVLSLWIKNNSAQDCTDHINALLVIVEQCAEFVPSILRRFPESFQQCECSTQEGHSGLLRNSYYQSVILVVKHVSSFLSYVILPIGVEHSPPPYLQSLSTRFDHLEYQAIVVSAGQKATIGRFLSTSMILASKFSSV